MRKGLILIGILLLAFGISFAVWAATFTSSSVTVTGTATPGIVTTSVPAGVTAKYSAAPSWTPVARRAGTVTAGDLFYVDASSSTADLTATLSLLNAGALQVDYRFLNLQVTVWLWDGVSAWSVASVVSYTAATQSNPALLTLANGQAAFTLAGSKIYEVSISGGSFYCLTTTGTGGSLSPSFTLDVN